MVAEQALHKDALRALHITFYHTLSQGSDRDFRVTDIKSR
jgi:hypothetical protein